MLANSVRSAPAGRVARRHAATQARVAALGAKKAVGCAPVLSALQRTVASAPGMQRVCELVCEARQGSVPAENVFTALRRAALPPHPNAAGVPR